MREPWRQLVSADGAVALALHRFIGVDPDAVDPPATTEPASPIVLISHATGFHAHCYRAVAESLPTGWTAVGIDHRGHGYTAPDPSTEHLGDAPAVDWADFGSDATQTASWLRDRYRSGVLIGFGHSMGASALITAAAQHRDLFSALVLFEPIAPSGFINDDPDDHGGSQLAVGAARRRRTFASVEAAIDNYSAKPPFDKIAPTVLRDYVTHGFAPAFDGVTLRCRPEYEAATFNAAMTNGAWEAMPDVTTPTIVAAGSIEPDQPSAWAPAIAKRIPNAELVVLDEQDHFGPFAVPAASAALVASAAERIAEPAG